MNLEQLEMSAARACDEPGGNYVSEQDALAPELAGMRIFEAPSLCAADARDGLFTALRGAEAVGPQFALPREWLPSARSVVSFFFPFTDRVNRSNAATRGQPSAEWLHARIEGQAFIETVMKRLCGELASEGFASLAPSHEPAFRAFTGVPGEDGRKIFTSNWSERHVAHICGLGTFGLSRGLITKRGVSGRFGSIVTALELLPTPREYDGLYDWCAMCGACARACPANAITLAEGKDHVPCSALVDETKAKYKPRYGCGKCQSGMPCQSRPLRNPGVRV